MDSSGTTTTDSSGGSSAAGCYGGGDIAGAVIGSLLGGLVLAYLLYRLYAHYWRNRKDNNLVHGEDPENAKQEFAFDNPAFRNEKQKASGGNATNAAGRLPLDTKWTFNKKAAVGSNDQQQQRLQRHSPNDATAAITRSVSLCGSDFTGLGIEICGGGGGRGKDAGIYVRKVAPQGPAASIVRTGDRIVSITIDVQHMVQEDAATILSYASPYNVQLELLDGNGTLPRSVAAAVANHSSSASPAQRRPDSTSAVTTTATTTPQLTEQTLYTVESETNAEPNARRQLFAAQQPQEQQQQSPASSTSSSSTPEDAIANYPTLKLEASPPTTTTTNTTTTTVHRENEKLQQRAPVVTVPETASIQVHPDVIQMPAGETPPIVNKRTKHLKNVDAHNAATIDEKTDNSVEVQQQQPSESVRTQPPQSFQRADARNESGIRRDAAGIPQEIPDQMFAAAMAARGNRKSQATALDEQLNEQLIDHHHQPHALDLEAGGNDSNVVSVVSVSVDEQPAERERTKSAKRPPRPPARGDSLVETARVAANLTSMQQNTVGDESPLGSAVTTIDVECDSAPVTKIDVDRRNSAAYVEEPQLNADEQRAAGTINIELNSNHITVHHASEQQAPSAVDAPMPIPIKRQHHDIRITDQTNDSASDVPVSAAAAAATTTTPIQPSPKPRSSIISLDASSLVEQVLAAADSFSLETRNTLSRQLSELNDDTHIPDVVVGGVAQTNGQRPSYTDMDIGTQEEILNNYKFKAEPVLLSSMSSSQYQFEVARPTADAIDQLDAVSGELGVASKDLLIAATAVDNDDDSKIRYGLNIPDDVKVSQSSLSALPTSAAVFSSDGHGINSISISSLDISAAELEQHITASSQPSSIIAIDDEDLEFTVHRSPAPMTMASMASVNGLNNNGVKTPTVAAAPTNGNDVFIIESLSSMKTLPATNDGDDDEALIHSHTNNNHNSTSFEIQLAPAAATAATNGVAVSASKPPASPPRAKLQQIPQPQQRRTSPPSNSTTSTVDRIPRNSEMRFSTATYEERPPRLSGVAGSASKPPAFERGHTQSEIPVLVRRPSNPGFTPPSPSAAMSTSLSSSHSAFSGGSHSQSTSSLASLPRTSPSKIPVFSSPSGGGGGGGSTKSGYNSSGSSTNGYSPPVQARTNGNGFLYRSHSSLQASASSARGGNGTSSNGVTVSAIKNSSRNPSGK